MPGCATRQESPRSRGPNPIHLLPGLELCLVGPVEIAVSNCRLQLNAAPPIPEYGVIPNQGWVAKDSVRCLPKELIMRHTFYAAMLLTVLLICLVAGPVAS